MARADEYPNLFILKEKHSESNYLINSPEDLHRVATSIVRSRAATGYYYDTDVEKLIASREEAIDGLIERSGLSKDLAPRTPEGIREIMALKGTDEDRAARLLGVDPAALAAYPAPLKATAIEGAQKYVSNLPRILTNFQRDIEDAENILKIVSTEKAEELDIEHRNRRVNLALWILESRSDYEYEGYEFESFQAIPTAEDLEASRKKS